MPFGWPRFFAALRMTFFEVTQRSLFTGMTGFTAVLRIDRRVDVVNCRAMYGLILERRLLKQALQTRQCLVPLPGFHPLALPSQGQCHCYENELQWPNSFSPALNRKPGPGPWTPACAGATVERRPHFHRLARSSQGHSDSECGRRIYVRLAVTPAPSTRDPSALLRVTWGLSE